MSKSKNLHAEVERLTAELKESKSRVDALEKELEQRNQMAYIGPVVTMEIETEAASEPAKVEPIKQVPFHVRVREWFRKKEK